METIAKIDMWLLGKFQAVTNFVYKWIGVNNFTLSRACLLVSCLSFIRPISLYHRTFSPIDLLNMIMAWWIWYRASFIVTMVEKMGMSLIVESFLGRIRFFFVINFITTTSLMMMLVAILRTFDYDLIIIEIMFLSLLSFVYFLSCSPPPKRKSKVKELKEAAAKKAEEVVEALAPRSTPVPV